MIRWDQTARRKIVDILEIYVEVIEVTMSIKSSDSLPGRDGSRYHEILKLRICVNGLD